MPDITMIETYDSLYVFDQENNEWVKGWWNVFTIKGKSLTKAISIATAATHVIIPAVGAKRICITSLMFTVGGEVNITLYNGDTALSGAMDFGGTSEPRGMVSNFDNRPMELSDSLAFKIVLSAAVQVSGFVCYHLE